MDKNQKKVLSLTVTAVVTVILLLLLGFFSYRVKFIGREFTIELGDPVSEDPFDYIKGFQFAVKRTEVDTADVDHLKAGTYEVHIKHAWQKFTSVITIVDTTPPELILDQDVKYLEKDKNYTLKDFVQTAKDLSGKVDVVIQVGDATLTDNITYKKNGSYQIVIVATDVNLNRTVQSLDVIVDTPPEFGGKMPDYYVATGSEIDYLAGLTAWDEHDGDLTDKIEADVSRVNMEEAGEYTVVYSVADEYGFESSTTNTLHVLEKSDLQQLINTHQINRNDQTIVGAYNLYDSGVYEEDDIDFVLEQLTPAFVCLKYEYGNGGWSRGSGYIVEITEDEIVICTNEHVVSKYETMDVYFYDGTGAKAAILSTGAATCTEKDIAFAKVSRDQLSEEFINTLKTVHIDEEYWNNLPQYPDISAGVKCILTKGDVWHEKTGRLTVKKAVMSEAWRRYGLFSHVTVKLVPGVSGSAIVDGHGNLVGMAVGHGDVKGVMKYFAITLDNIIETYEEYMGHKPNYM